MMFDSIAINIQLQHNIEETIKIFIYVYILSLGKSYDKKNNIVIRAGYALDN